MSANTGGDRPREDTHPLDELPDFVHGTLSSDREREILAHAEECPTCAEELDVVSLLAGQPVPAMTVEERSRTYERIAFGRRESGGSGSRLSGGTGWRSAAWKVAAAIAVLATGVGVWQVYLTGSSGSGWSATAVLEAWEEDVSELDPSAEDAAALLTFIEPESMPPADDGFDDYELDRVVEGVMDGFEPGVLDGIAVPWEE